MRTSGLLPATGWMLSGQGTRAILQAVYFVALARVLGPHEFGYVAAALAIVFVLVPFAGWGSGGLLVRAVSRDSGATRVAWGNALFAIAVSGVALLVVVTVLAVAVVPGVPLAAVLLLAGAEFFFGRVSETALQVFQASERMRATALLTVVPHAGRAAAAVGFALVAPHPSATSWGFWYLATALATAGIGAAVVGREYGAPRLDLRGLARDLRDGGYFALSFAASTINADIDKAMLARLANPSVAGIYAAAYRVMGIAFVPVLSLMYATYARFFKTGAHGLRHSTELARQVSRYSAGYGIAAAVGLFLCAPLVPVVLGSDYAEAAQILRWLAVVPLLQGLYYPAADALTGAGHQGARSAIQIGVAALNIGLNAWLIPLYGWQGAAVATVGCAATLATAFWLAIASLGRRETTLEHGERPRLAGV